jgi:hypothetical protein
MAIHFAYQVDGNTLLVRAVGFDDSLEDVQAYGLAIIRACQDHGVTHVLCDELDLEYRLGTVDTFRAAEFIASQVPALARAAIVCNPRFIADAAFWETVAVNRGLTVRAFTDTTTAMAWLKTGIVPAPAAAMT